MSVCQVRIREVACGESHCLALDLEADRLPFGTVVGWCGTSGPGRIVWGSVG